MSAASLGSNRSSVSPVPLALEDAAIGDVALHLAEVDPDLSILVERNGTPPAWFREPGFCTLVNLILEQQVSLASAAAAYRRLEEALGAVAPAAFSRLSDSRLRAIGFSRQKADYCRTLANGLQAGTIDLEGMAALPDGEARSRLTSLRGVGPWTAECYLLFALRRADAWPNGDRALQVSLGRALDLDDVPSAIDADAHAERWRPWRSVAARILWQDYLATRPGQA